MNIKELLYRSESDSLDFKEEQYKFINENNPYIKSELLKDILAFANAWRDSDAYILIGIKENNKSEHEIIGISETIDDASLQEFVNSKTNKAIKFEYVTITIEDKLIAYIKIPIQKRPFYIKKDYGKLKSNTVYLRRGSATVIANPDEISDMGEAIVKNNHIVSNPTDYTLTAKFIPMNIDSEKKIIEANINQAKIELQSFDVANNRFKPIMAISLYKKPKDKTIYEDELKTYKVKLHEYIEYYNDKLKTINKIFSIYYLKLFIENTGKTSDTHINIDIDFTKGKLLKKNDLLSFFLNHIHKIPFPKRPLEYTEVKFLNGVKVHSLDKIYTLPKLTDFHQNINTNLTNTNISIIIKNMNVGDNFFHFGRKVILYRRYRKLRNKYNYKI